MYKKIGSWSRGGSIRADIRSERSQTPLGSLWNTSWTLRKNTKRHETLPTFTNMYHVFTKNMTTNRKYQHLRKGIILLLLKTITLIQNFGAYSHNTCFMSILKHPLGLTKVG